MILALLQHAAAPATQTPSLPPIDAHAAVDSAVVESPLPGGAAAAFRWFFNQPQWLQIGGLVVGLVVAIVVLTVAWRRRRELGAWFAARPRAWKLGFVGAATALALLAIGSGAWTWNYMQHDNGFCVSCHVMTPAFTRFQTSEHRKLECHDCHRQSVFASAQELYYWVAERPDKIPPHAPVPTRVCSECHVTDDPDSTWQRIVATAGHRIHLESDSSALDKVECVTCHGQEVHRFVPVDLSCGQSGCHEQVEIRLGKMAGQTTLHCTGCHAFTRTVSEEIPLDSARRDLVPAEPECLGCHAMREQLADFDANLDPHKGTCGACHNPHEQETPEAAFETCATSGCHVRPDTLTPYHRGISEAALAKCGDCHAAHQWTVGEKTCLSCHADVMRDGAAGRGIVRHASLQQRSDFSHRRHRDVACTQCHSMERTHGELTVRTERDCQSCHHATDARAGTCAACHTTTEIAATRREPQPMRLTVWREPRSRPLPFDHDEHRTLDCTGCHTQALTFAVERTCTSCHAQHHEPTADCTSCHLPPKAAHTRAAHLGCSGSGCHLDQVSPRLTATRSTCLTCHVDLVRHQPGKQCAACHQVAWSPGARGVAR